MNSAQRLLEINPTASDDIFAALIAEALLESDRQPYCFSINHDIRPPKNKACPLPYDWALAARLGITTHYRVRAREWIIQAALARYTVSQARAKTLALHGLSLSIRTARARAEYHQRPNKENDDDIPF